MTYEPHPDEDLDPEPVYPDARIERTACKFCELVDCECSF